MLHNPLHTPYLFLQTQALHLKDMGGKKQGIPSLPWSLKLGSAERGLLHGTLGSKGITPDQEGIPALRGPSCEALAPSQQSTYTPALLFRWAGISAAQTQSAQRLTGLHEYGYEWDLFGDSQASHNALLLCLHGC